MLDIIDHSHGQLQSLLTEALALQDNFLCSAPLALVFTDERVGLIDASQHKQAPVCVDFIAGTLAHRRKYGGGRKSEVVARACFANKEQPLIFDATAGLGRDAFVLCCLGATVHLFERNPVVRLLLKDGLRRAYADATQGEFFQQHLILEEANSIALYQGSLQPDTVYLDPMYPERKKSALVKKDMRIFHDLVGADLDSNDLVAIARKITLGRVVVKKPKWAEIIEPKACVASITTPNHRFDIYKPC